MNTNKFIYYADSIINSSSVKNIHLKINNSSIILLFHQGLTDIKRFNEYYFPFINKDNLTHLHKKFPGIFFLLNEDSFDVYSEKIFTGNLLFYIKEQDILYGVDLAQIPSRTIETNSYDPKSLFGSLDSFIEEIKINLSLLENRIKDPSLTMDDFIIGKRSKTKVKLIYIQDLINPEIIKIITKKLNSINIDSVTSIHDIAHVFSSQGLFPSVSFTASPEIAEESITTGRALIMVDTLPVSIVAPVSLEYFISLKEETSSPIYYLIYTRLLIFLLGFVSVFLLGFYYSLVSYHGRNLSLTLISEIKITARGSNLPLFAEIMFILFLFEFLRLASTRTPLGGMQSFVIVVGGLLIGQNVVQSGFVGAFTIVITALSYLSGYAISNHQHFITSIFHLQIIVLIGGAILGLFGVLIVTIIATIYLHNKESIGMPYLTPLSPLITKDFFNLFTTKTFKKGKNRPEGLKTKDSIRGR